MGDAYGHCELTRRRVIGRFEVVFRQTSLFMSQPVRACKLYICSKISENPSSTIIQARDQNWEAFGIPMVLTMTEVRLWSVRRRL